MQHEFEQLLRCQNIETILGFSKYRKREVKSMLSMYSFEMILPIIKKKDRKYEY